MSNAISQRATNTADNIINYFAHTPTEQLCDNEMAGHTPAVERMVQAAIAASESALAAVTRERDEAIRDRDNAQQWIDSEPDWKDKFMAIDREKDARIKALEEELTLHKHRVITAHNAGISGMPQGDCTCSICAPFIREKMELGNGIVALKKERDEAKAQLAEALERIANQQMALANSAEARSGFIHQIEQYNNDLTEARKEAEHWKELLSKAEDERDSARAQLADALAQVVGMREALEQIAHSDDNILPHFDTEGALQKRLTACVELAEKALSSAPSGGSGEDAVKPQNEMTAAERDEEYRRRIAARRSKQFPLD